VIDTAEKLRTFLRSLELAPWIALDTEANSLHAYPEQLCLIQISIPGSDELVDPLATLDLAPLFEALQGKELILHGADYDLRLLHRNHQFVPGAVLDTMWAARLLGYTVFGLTDLVAANLGMTLEKGPQKMDWARRPLTERMEAYARNDTRYLKPLMDLLAQRLSEKGRLGWLREIGERLIAETSRARMVDSDRVWRVKGSDRLTPPALAILRELWHWREQEAVLANRPPYFILSHEILVAIATAASQGQGLAGLLPRQLSARRQASLAAAIQQGQNVPPRACPGPSRAKAYRLTREEQTRLEELAKRRDARAGELEIDPTIIASRSLLTELVRHGDVARGELMKWQRELLFREES
jgi:ribonuclease D